ncbi:MAG: BatD family protein [Thermoanaerobaculia bacterium]|nr:BatD family protein [Thermoanaerobaculia bacterium]
MSRGRRRLAGAAFVYLLAPPWALAAAEPEVELSVALAPDPVGLDEMARLTLVVQASGFGLPRVEPGFLLDNFEGAGGPSRSQSTSWVNGVSASRLELTWRLRPLAVGRARVHAFRVALGEEVRSLADLAVTVVEQAPPGRAPRQGAAPGDPFARLFEDDPFGIFPRRPRRDEPVVQPKLALRSLLAPREAYVGEQVGWTLALDTQTDISGFRPRALPEFAGFWAREIELPERPQPEWVEVDGERFGRVAMLARALFPLRAGELPVERITVDVMARRVDTDWLGGLRRDEPVELATRPQTVTARPLPPPPAGFGGVVGRVELAAELEPTRLAAGQAATLVVRATTDGNPQGVEPPRPKLPEGLRSFPPSTASRERVVDGRLQTTVEWRHVVLADRAGEFELPAMQWVHFDPAARRYATATTAPLRLSVAPSTAPPPAPPPDALSPDAPAAAPRAPASTLPAGAIAAAAAALALAAGWIWRRRRRPAALLALRRALDEAAAIAAPRDAAKAIDVAWRALLAERYGLGRGTPAAHWPAALAAGGWRAARVAELQRLFEELHLLEFAPELSDAEALRRDIDRRSLELARRLR